MRIVILGVFLVVTGCVNIPDGFEPVGNFEVNRYLCKWHEIARLDHSFERGLIAVTAEYSKREDGGIKVINRGFNTASNTWEEAEGRAYFVEGSDMGYLKVSFFGPFFGAYIVFDLGNDYEYSLVTSSDRSYLWLLARSPMIDDALKTKLLDKMSALGFATQALIFVDPSL